jgi:hypothetical protein
MHTRLRRRPPYPVLLGVMLSTSTAATMTLASPVSALADPSSCGATGTLTDSNTCTYTTVGSDTFTVPDGVDSIEITVVGAQGGHYFIAGDAAHGGSPAGDITGRSGGSGGQASGTLASLTSGQVLQVDVAGRGVDGTAASRSGGMMNGPSGGSGALGGFGGSNGGTLGGPGDADGANGGTALGNGGNGSGGGGTSDVRLAAGGCAALTCALSDRVLVGAGGGGGGGVGGQGNALGGAGGNGGGTSGANGGTTVDGGNAGVSGTGGTSSAGEPEGSTQASIPLAPTPVTHATAVMAPTVPLAPAVPAALETCPAPAPRLLPAPVVKTPQPRAAEPAAEPAVATSVAVEAPEGAACSVVAEAPVAAEQAAVASPQQPSPPPP